MKKTEILRWFGVVPAAIVGWYAAFLFGVSIWNLLSILCPNEADVSGQCIAPWFEMAEALVLVLAVALSGFLVVYCAAVVAPRFKYEIAKGAYGSGLLVALIFAVELGAWKELAGAAVGGMLAVWLLRSKADERARNA